MKCSCVRKIKKNIESKEQMLDLLCKKLFIHLVLYISTFLNMNITLLFYGFITFISMIVRLLLRSIECILCEFCNSHIVKLIAYKLYVNRVRSYTYSVKF